MDRHEYEENTANLLIKIAQNNRLEYIQEKSTWIIYGKEGQKVATFVYDSGNIFTLPKIILEAKKDNIICERIIGTRLKDAFQEILNSDNNEQQEKKRKELLSYLESQI